MTGLEKILQQIQQDAQAAAEEILQQARDQAQELMQQAQHEAQLQVKRLQESTRAYCEELAQREKSAAALEQKRRLLKTKQDCIRHVLIEARQALVSLPEDQYFDLLLRILDKAVLPEKGEILFPPADRQRLPENYLKRINEVAAAHKGALTLAAADRPLPVGFSDGFILIYGGIEMNCTFEAMFAGKQEALQDCAHHILFPAS